VHGALCFGGQAREKPVKGGDGNKQKEGATPTRWKGIYLGNNIVEKKKEKTRSGRRGTTLVDFREESRRTVT